MAPLPSAPSSSSSSSASASALPAALPSPPPRTTTTTATNLGATIARLAGPSSPSSPSSSSTTAPPPSRSLRDEWRDLHGGGGGAGGRWKKPCPGVDACKNVLCEHKFAVVTAGTQPDSRLLPLLLRAAAKDGYPVSTAFASAKLAQRGNKLVPALVSIKNEIDNREFALHYTGRISVPYERVTSHQVLEQWKARGEDPTGKFSETRDAVIESLEVEDKVLRSEDREAWKMLFGLKSTTKQGEKEGEEYAQAVHDGEKRYREERAKYWVYIRGDSELNEAEIEKCMEEWENEHAGPGTFGRAQGGIGSVYRRPIFNRVGSIKPAIVRIERVDLPRGVVVLEIQREGDSKPVREIGAKARHHLLHNHGKITDRCKLVANEVYEILVDTTPCTSAEGEVAPACIRLKPLCDGIGEVMVDCKIQLQHTRAKVQNTRQEIQNAFASTPEELLELAEKKANLEAIERSLKKQEAELKDYERLLKKVPKNSVPVASSMWTQGQRDAREQLGPRVPLYPVNDPIDVAKLALDHFYEKPVVKSAETDQVQMSKQDAGGKALAGDVDPLEESSKGSMIRFQISDAHEVNAQASDIKGKGKAIDNSTENASGSASRPRYQATVEDEDDNGAGPPEPIFKFTVTDYDDDTIQPESSYAGNADTSASSSSYNPRTDKGKGRATQWDEDKFHIESILYKFRLNTSLDEIMEEMEEEERRREQEAIDELDDLQQPFEDLEAQEDAYLDSILLPEMDRNALFNKLDNIALGTFKGKVAHSHSQEDIELVKSWGCSIEVLARALMSLANGSSALAAEFYVRVALPEMEMAFETAVERHYDYAELEQFKMDVELYDWACRLLKKLAKKEKKAAKKAAQRAKRG